MGRAGQIRRRVFALGRRGRGARLPSALRREIGEYARRRRREGAGLREIAVETGVSPESVRRFASATLDEHPEAAIVPVRVVAEPAGFVFVAPGGFRIEGLDVDTAALLLRRLA